MADYEPLVDAVYAQVVSDEGAMQLLAHIGAEGLADLIPNPRDMTLGQMAEVASRVHDALVGAMLVGIIAATAHQQGVTFAVVSEALGEAVERHTAGTRARGIRVAGGDG